MSAMCKPNSIIKLRNYPILAFLFIAPFFVVNTSSALTRLDACQEKETAAAVEECKKKVDIDAWNLCITKPAEQRGKCAEDFKNESVALDQPSKETILDTNARGGVCGDVDPVKTIINIGCRGRGNPIVDMLFAVIRVLSVGVGVVVIGSIIFAGIQYVTSAGNPNQAQAAIGRIRNTVFALILYLFAYALLNWLIPMGVF